MRSYRFLSLAALVLSTACSNDPSPQVRFATSSLGALNLGVALTVELTVRCDNGQTTTILHDVAIEDSDAQAITVGGLPACGDARLTLQIFAEQAPRILAFRGEQAVQLFAYVTVPVVFEGPALGELTLTATADSVCRVTNAAGVSADYEVTANTLRRVSVPIGDYTISCTSDTAPQVDRTATIGVGARSDVDVVFVPIADDLTLAGITIDGVAIADFAPQRDRYTTPQYDITKTTAEVTATATSPDALVTLGTTVSQGSATDTVGIPFAATPLAITVTRGDRGAVYVVTFSRDRPALVAVSPDYPMLPSTFDPSVTAYTIYYPSSATTPLLTFTCDPNCTGLATRLGQTDRSDASTIVIDTPVGTTQTLTVDATAPAHTNRTYTFSIVHGMISNLVCDTQLDRPFAPTIYQYDTTTPQVSGTYTCRPTANGNAIADNVSVALTGNGNVLTINGSTPAGEVLDTYAVNVSSVTEILLIYNHNPEEQFLESGPLVSGNRGGREPALTASTGMLFPYPTAALQLPNTNRVYFLRNNGDNIRGVTTATFAGDGSLSQRAVVADATSQADYIAQLPINVPMQGLTFHARGGTLYTTQASILWAIPIDGPFIDGLDAGQPGLAHDPVPFSTSVDNAGNTIRLYATADGRLVLWFKLGFPDRQNFYALETSTTNGQPATGATLYTIGTTGQPINDVALANSERVIFYSDPTGLHPLRYDVTTLAAPSLATISTEQLVSPSIVPHPTQSVVYAYDGASVCLYSYDDTTGATTFRNSYAYTDLAYFEVSPDGATFLIMTRNDSSTACSLDTGTIGPNGELSSSAGSSIDCSAITLHFGVARVATAQN